MNEAYIFSGFLVLLFVQIALNEIDKRRSIRREDSLIKMVKSLQNRISSKDLATFITLEQQESPPPPRPMQPPSAENMFESLPFGMNGGTFDGSA